jgi:hypothetical protein
MNNLGWGLLLDLYFWIGVASAMLFFGVWACIELFLGVAQKAQETIRVVRNPEASSLPSLSDEVAEEPFWNPS